MEEELFIRFASGEREAIEQAVARYFEQAVFFALSFVKDYATAEDVAEDSFAKLLVKRSSIKKESSFRTYLFKTVRNTALDALRKRKKTVNLEAATLSEAVTESPEHAAFLDERKRILASCMDKLSDDYREILTLLYLEEFDVAQCSKITGKSKKQIYNLSSRAKTALRQILTKEGFSYEDL